MNASRTLLGDFLAAVVGLAAAAIVLWQLQSSESTLCFRQSVQISIAETDEVLSGCDLRAFDAVREYIEDQRRRLEVDENFVPDEPEEMNGRSTLIVWMAIFSATAGVAGVSAVLSGFMIADMRHKGDLPSTRVLISCLVATTLVALPFLLIRSVRVSLSPYEDLHGPQLTWMPLVVGLLTLPAATGLIVIWNIVSSRTDLSLDDVAVLGAKMRHLISMLGAVLSLSVLATGSRWQVIAALPGGESVPSTVILLWGGVFAVVMGALYVPAYQRWATVTGTLISEEVKRQFSEFEGPGTPGYRASELSAKRELQATLGVGGALKTLQGSLAVLAPIIAAAISSLFS